MDIIATIFMVFYLFVFFSLGALMVKNQLTKHFHLLLLHAIHDYNIDKIRNGIFTDFIDYDVLEDYNETLWRLWDWGYKNIVPSNVLEKILPYIESEG